MTHSYDHTDSLAYAERYAGVPMRRGLAWLFDMGFIVLLAILVLPFTAFTGIFFFPFLLLVIGFLYRWMTISGGSSTWGMRLMGVTLVDREGLPFTSGTAFLHTLGYSVSVAMPPLQLISVIMMLVTERGQGLTDMVLGTEAVNTRALLP